MVHPSLQIKSRKPSKLHPLSIPMIRFPPRLKDIRYGKLFDTLRSSPKALDNKVVSTSIPRCCVIVSNYLEIGGNGWYTVSDARHFKQEVTSRVYDNAFKICISAREFHDPAARMWNASISRRSDARKTGSRSSRASKPETNRKRPAGLREIWEVYGKRDTIMQNRGAILEREFPGRHVTCRYDRFLKRCPECDARQTFVGGKVKLVGGKKRRDKRRGVGSR